MKDLFSLVMNLTVINSTNVYSLSTIDHSSLNERKMLVSREDFKNKEVLWTFYNRDRVNVDILKKEIEAIDIKIRPIDNYDAVKQIVFIELNRVLKRYGWSPMSEEAFFIGSFIK